MSATPLNHAVSDDPIHQTRVDLAACLRMAVLDDLHEGIDNHFTVVVPGHTDQYFVLPFGLHWSEARASDLIIFNEAGETIAGDGIVEEQPVAEREARARARLVLHGRRFRVQLTAVHAV